MRLTEAQVYAKGYASNIEYKRNTVAQIQAEVCRLIGIIGDKSLLSMLTSPIDARTNDMLTLAACEAAISIGDHDFRERQIDRMKYYGTRELLLKDFFK